MYIYTQIVLLSWWFNKKNLVKKPIERPNPNGRVQIDLSKITIWSSWTWGQKNHKGGFFDRTS
jgi:hypothetical protein